MGGRWGVGRGWVGGGSVSHRWGGEGEEGMTEEVLYTLADLAPHR